MRVTWDAVSKKNRDFSRNKTLNVKLINNFIQMKLLYIIPLLLLPFITVSQNTEIASALRNSQYFYGGSARFTAMGGAFTSLGGDITSLSLNPASVGVYSGLQMVFTPSLKFNNVKTNVLGTSREDFEYDFSFHNIGLISSYNLMNDTRWKSFSFAIGYNQLSDFNNQIVGNYRNDERSLMQSFVDNANDSTRWFDYEELAWDSYLMNYDTTYWTPITDVMNSDPDAGIDQEKIISTEGSLGEYFITVGGNYSDKLFLGAGISILRYNFKIQKIYKETDTRDDIYWFDSFRFQEYEKHTSTGINMKLGAIYKPVEAVRLGLAIHTPTFFNSMSYQWYNSMTTHTDDGNSYPAETDTYQYNYQLTTPFRLLTGASFRIGNFAIVSADYEYIDYSMNRLKLEDGTNMIEDNDFISANYGKGHNIRVGSEFKYDRFYMRLGYAFYDAPQNDKSQMVYSNYRNNDVESQTNRQIYSAGIGYRENSFFIDAAYKYSFYQTNDYLIQPIDDPVNTQFDINKFIVSLGFRF